MTLRLLKRTVLSLSLIVMTLSCSEHRDEKILLADSLSLACPDSAMAIMDSIGQTKDRLSRSERMYYELIRAKVQNRAYVDFTTDSVMLEVADYYDHHGTANDRMLAHYLLGCTYRDLKEAPMSLQCYYDAVEAADTLSLDCDYSTLMSIWGQIAYLLNNQCMPMDALSALKYYQKYALLNGDTLNYIKGLEQRLMAYNMMGDTAKIIETTENAQRLYLEHGFPQQAARTVTSVIYVWLNRQDYDKVRILQALYETQSGFFDECGNIKKGKEHYYCGKGMYYEGIGKLDSAEYSYRKLFRAGHTFDACNGLTRIYKKIGNIDSVSYYSTLKDSVFNEMVTDMHAEAMHQVKGMYDYSRQQKISSDKAKEAYYLKFVISVIIIIVIITAFVLSYCQSRYKIRKKEEIRKATRTYYETLSQLRNSQDELAKLEIGFDEFKEQKRLEISELEKQIDCLNQHSNIIDNETTIEYIKEHPIVNNFKRNLEPGVSDMITSKQWDDFLQFIHTIIPHFYLAIQPLRQQEQQVAILTKLGFTNNETSYILRISKQQVTNAKSHANHVLFHENSARTFTKNIQGL